MEKKWWSSKTLWVNAVAILGLVAQNALGMDLGAEAQVGLLALVNMGLRAVTKSQVVWR